MCRALQDCQPVLCRVCHLSSPQCLVESYQNEVIKQISEVCYQQFVDRCTFCAVLQTSYYPFVAHCCHMGTATKLPVPDQVKPSFVIFNIRALLCSGLSVRVPGCQKLQMTSYPGLTQL